MKKFVFGIIPVLVLVLVSCNLDFSDTQATPTPTVEDVTTYVDETFTGGLRTSTYVNDVLKNYVDKFYGAADTAEADVFVQAQYYSALGTLLSTETYSYDLDGNVQVVSTYDTSGNLDHFQVQDYVLVGSKYLPSQYTYYVGDSTFNGASSWTYDANGNMTKESTFDAAGNISSARTWAFEYEGAKNDLIQEDGYVIDSGSATLASRIKTTWDSSDRELTRTWYGSADTTYKSVSSASVTASKSLAGAALPRGELAADKVHAQIELTQPALPEAYTLPSVELNNVVLTAKQYQYWHYDSYGTASAVMDSAWFPVALERTDSRLPAILGLTGDSVAVDVAVEWEATGNNLIPKRPVRKVTSVNGTEALDIGLTYYENGLPNVISTSGAAMPVPLDFTLAYNDNSVPTSLVVSSNGSALRSLEYEYFAADSSAAGPEQPSTTDPMQVLAFARNVHVISDYDGDHNLQETFTFTYTDKGSYYVARVDVAKADGTSNGHYIIAYDSKGMVGTVASYNKKNKKTWSWSCNYDQAVSGLNYLQRIGESYVTEYITDSESKYLQSMGSNFIYQLLFN